MTSNRVQENIPVFQLKGGLYTLTALQLLGNNLSAFEKQLENKIQQAPKFFKNAPIVVDLQKLNPNSPLDFVLLKDILLRKKLIPIGIKSGSAALQESAIAVGFPILNESAKEKVEPRDTTTGNMSEATAITTQTTITGAQTKAFIDSQKTAIDPNELKNDFQNSPSRVVTEPVRSGQQIYARGGDLIVLAPVSHGSELLADGHIHVYGPLRGRALAGIGGDTGVHIFCHSLEAELISIAGQYKISEDIAESSWKQAVDISLVENRLHIKPF